MNVDCRKTEQQMVDLIDGRLPPPAELRAHAHLESCASCRDSFARWQRLLPAMREPHPEPLQPLALRRIEIGIEHGLAERPSRPVVPAVGWLRRRWWAPLAGAGVALAAAVLMLWRPVPTTQEASVYGRLERLAGSASVDGKPFAPGAVLAAGAVVEVGATSEIGLGLGRAVRVTLTGPARVALHGDAQTVRMRLGRGQLAASVGPRQAGEAFTVETTDGRVEVHGTRFTVAALEQGSWVRVDEGRVAVFRKDDPIERQVSAGETLWLSVAPAAAVAAVPVPAPGLEPAADEAVPESPRASCEVVTARVRAALRAGQASRAVHLAGRRPAEGARAEGRCLDDLGYLRAESLRAAGRLGEAIAAYRHLDRPTAPPAMRQNALFAAAELELRVGRSKAALRDFEAALAVSPAGALHEDAMARTMEAALAAGTRAQAESAARRYLAAFPSGTAASRAHRILGATDSR